MKGLTLGKSVFDVCAGIGLWADLRKGLYRYRSIYTYMRRVLKCAFPYDSLICPEVHVLIL